MSVSPCVTSTFQKHKCGSVAVKIPYSICHDIDGSVVPVTSHSLGVFWTTNKTSAGKGGITFLSLIASGGTHCFPGFLLILKIEGGSHLLLFTPCFTVAQSFFQSSSTASPDRTRRPDGSHSISALSSLQILTPDQMFSVSGTAPCTVPSCREQISTNMTVVCWNQQL